jgi:predicted methyltransferase
MTLDRRKKEIVEYIGTHENPDSVEIVNYIKLPCDITLNALRELEEVGVIACGENRAYRILGLKRALLK